MLLNDLMNQFNESLDKAAGPKFTGYWKGKDAGTPGKKMVGGESIDTQVSDTNPTDKITMDIPLFIRMMEYAREDAKDDMDLHQVTARAIQLMQQHDALDMNSYDTIINDQEPVDEGWLDKVYAAGRNFADTASLGTAKYGRAGIDWAAKNAMHQLGYADQGTSYQKELDQEIEKLDKDWKEEPGASLAGMGAALSIPVAGEYGAAVKGAQGLAGQALDTYGKAVKMYPLAKAALGYKDMKNPKVEDIAYQNPNLTPDQINKMNSTIQKTLKNKPYDADKSAKDPRSFQKRLPQGKETAPMPEYNRDVPSLMKTVPKKPSSQKMINASMEMDEEKKGLYYYVNKRKEAGTSRDKNHPKAPSAQDWKNAAKTAKESVELEEGLLGKAVGLIGFYYGAKLGLPDAIMNTMDLPLGTYEIMQHLLGAGVGAVAGSAVGDAVGAGAKKLIAKMLWGAIAKAAQSIKGGTPQQQAMKNLDAEVKAIEAKIKQAAATGGKAEPKLFKDKELGEFRDTAKYGGGDDNNKNINHEIFQLLKNGAKVYSNAAGRMGEILRANNDSVIIKTKRGKGSTSFNRGDAVKIKQDKSKPNTYYVVNVMDEGKKKGADGKACWDGYRYAGTENGKDKCVKVSK